MSIEAMKMALEAFEDIKKYVTDDGAMPENWDAYHEKEYYALEALRQAIEQAEQWDTSDMAHRSGGLSVEQENPLDIADRAYFAGKQAGIAERQWVGLTDEEIDAIYRQNHNQYNEDTTGEYERDLEAKLKEKNGG
jgi:hypothetical protein